jgi:hypothetical protein
LPDLEMTIQVVEPICVPNFYLQHTAMVGRRNLCHEEKAPCQIIKNGLIDALRVLYEDCNKSSNKKDPPTVNFVAKCKIHYQ